MPSLGIDFGTTKTIAAYWDATSRSPKLVLLGSGRHLLPTTVHVDAQGQFSFGDDADDQRATDAGGYVRRIKRDLGMGRSSLLNGHKFKSVDLIARFLKEIIEKSEKEALYAKVDHLVVTVPAAYGPTKRNELEDAVKLTGVTHFELLDEPVAAALAWIKLKGELGKSVMVFDWGGGTLDVAILEKHGEGYRAYPGLIGGDENLGGEDIDDRLICGMDQSLATTGKKAFDQRSDRERDLIIRRVRDLKLQHTRKDEVTWSFSLEDMSEPYSWKWTRSQFNEWIAADVNKAIKLAKTQFDAARSMGVTIDQVILVGGSSNIPLVAECLKEALGIEPLKWDHSIEAVAYGAAIQANLSTPLSEKSKRFIAEQKISYHDCRYLFEELCLLIWRNNNFGIVSAYGLHNALSAIQEKDEKSVVCQKVYQGLSSFNAIGFEDLIVQSSGMIPHLITTLIDNSPDSYIKRFPSLSDYKPKFVIAQAKSEDLRRQYYNGLKALREDYDCMIKFHAQLVEFYPRYSEILNRSTFWDFIMGGLIGIFTGGFGVPIAVAWSGWRGMQDKEFIENYSSGTQAFIQAGVRYSEKGEKILKQHVQAILRMWDEHFVYWEEIYLQIALMGHDLESVEYSMDRVSQEESNMLNAVFSNLKQRDDVPKHALNNIAKELKKKGVSIS